MSREKRKHKTSFRILSGNGLSIVVDVVLIVVIDAADAATLPAMMVDGRWPLVIPVDVLGRGWSRNWRRPFVWGTVRVRDAVSVRQLGVDWSERLALIAKPLLPVCSPGLKFGRVCAVETPVNGSQPLCFHGVEFEDRDTGDFGPGAVLERVVVEELAGEEEGDGESFVHFLRAWSVLQVFEAEEDSGGWKACARENLEDELPERWGWGCDAEEGILWLAPRGNLRDKVCHVADLVIEICRNTADWLLLLLLRLDRWQGEPWWWETGKRLRETVVVGVDEVSVVLRLVKRLAEAVVVRILWRSEREARWAWWVEGWHGDGVQEQLYREASRFSPSCMAEG